MPELPEVEEFRKKSKKALDKEIVGIEVNYEKPIKVSEKTLKRHLEGNKLLSTDRHGKHLFLEISDGYWLALHFGMTGDVSFWNKERPDHVLMNISFN